jgi:ATP-dependent exoDNAse (exonuclease V) alpha subunit
MVASVSALTSSAQASSYYEADDYYTEGGLSPSQWQGKGAEALGLSGEVDREQFRALLDGRIDDQQLGTVRDGQLEHIRFTRNDREAGRINGERAEVIGVDQQARTATIQTWRGATETLRLDFARDRHIAHGYVDTAFAAQGRTADHVIIHADSNAANLVDQKSFYVGISRARETATIFTNDRGKLVAAIGERVGQVQTAIAQAGASGLAAGNAKGAGLG